MPAIADLVDDVQPSIDVVGPSSRPSSDVDSDDETSDEEDEERPIAHGESPTEPR